ncbi:MAG: hypothetical protein M3Y87_11045 [Myxococcota bacterium]|nr:hypothetical protein [Myxococcota bacterium]
MNTPLTPPASDDIHAELDRLDRELETLRARLAHEQGVLHDARAHCRRLSEGPPTPDAAGDPGDAGSSDATAPAHTGRRLARTSRLESTLSSSRPSLRAIRGGGEGAHPSHLAPRARHATPSVAETEGWSEGPPDAA